MKTAIKKFLFDRFGAAAEDIRDDESLFAAGIVDSLRLMELIAFIEKTYGIRVNMGEVTVKNFDSIDSIIRLVSSKRRPDRGGNG